MGLNPGHIPDLEIKDTFPSTTGITGWTKNLYKDGVASGVASTVAEIGGTGNYSVAFTPDDNGLWAIQVFETADTSNEFVGSYHVYSPSEDVLYSGLSTSSLSTEFDAVVDSASSGTDPWLYHGHTIRFTDGASSGHAAVVQCFNDVDNTWLFTPRAPAAIASSVSFEITNETHPIQQDIIIRGVLSADSTEDDEMIDSVAITSNGNTLKGMSFILLKKGVVNVHRKIIQVDTASTFYLLDSDLGVTASSGDPYYIWKEYQELSSFTSIAGLVVASGTHTTTVFDAETLDGLDDAWNGQTIKFNTGDNAGMVRQITDYTDTNNRITVDVAFPSAPVAGDKFEILAQYNTTENLWDALTSEHENAGSFGKYIGQHMLTVAKYLAIK